MQAPRPRPHSLLYIGADALLRARVATYLEGFGLSVLAAESVVEARRLMNAHHFDVAVLDTEPGDPLSAMLIREAGGRGSPAVIVLAGRDDETDRIIALEAGADAYLSKPVSARALAAHIRAVCRRVDLARLPREDRNLARFDAWTVDLPAHRATAGDRTATLTGGEVGILRALLERPFVVFSRQELLTLARRDDAAVFDRAVDVLVSRLRHKLEVDSARPVYIETVRGEGYRFAKPVMWDSPSDVMTDLPTPLVDASADEPRVSAVSE